MRENQTKTIDGEEYTFYQLGAVASNKLLWRLKRIVGPSLAALFNNANGEGLDALLNSDIDYEEILNGFYERATEAEVDYVTQKLLSQVCHSGDGEISKCIDSHFKGRLSLMYKVLWEALKHEYSDFLGEGGIVASLKLKAVGNPKK